MKSTSLKTHGASVGPSSVLARLIIYRAAYINLRTGIHLYTISKLQHSYEIFWPERNLVDLYTKRPNIRIHELA